MTGKPDKKAAQSYTASQFETRIMAMASPDELKKIQRYFKTGAGTSPSDDVFVGVRMGLLFDLAKEFIAMPVDALEKMLESPIHEMRAGAMSIMDKKARSKKTTPLERKELFDLYIRRHDRINNWDLVDLAAIHVVGAYLKDKPRDILYKLAVSHNMWERRTAIVSTAYFLKNNECADTFNIAEILVNDPEDLVQKATGGWIRQAGKGDMQQLRLFLNRHAATMPRTTLRYAIEHMEPDERMHYLKIKSEN
ncbi:MAG: DNA alkylation repair protein [Taibaiella sp.]|nr:DNA alkylation repair protein [Taibaiella sp.]